MSKERWKRIHWRGQLLNYEVSSLGRVRHLHSKQIRNLRLDKRTGRAVFDFMLYRINGVPGTRRHHTIPVAVAVCEAFSRRPRKPGETVEHLDQNRVNNRASNLKFMSLGENIARSFRLTDRPRKTGRKLSRQSVDLLFRLWRSGRWSQVKIGQATGLAQGCVSRILGQTDRKAFGKRELVVDWQMLGADPAEFV